MSHRYEKEIIAFMRGQPLQFQSGNTTWYDFDAVKHESACLALLSGSDCLPFRIKPRTVKIGNREVEAPVLEPVEGQELWQVHEGIQNESRAQFKYHAAHSYAVERVKSGLAFSNPGAAREAAAAISALMRGEA